MTHSDHWRKREMRGGREEREGREMRGRKGDEEREGGRD